VGLFYALKKPTGLITKHDRAFLCLMFFVEGDIPVFFFSRFDLSMYIMNIQLATLPNPLFVSGCSIFKKLQQKTTAVWYFLQVKNSKVVPDSKPP
jgi:hypothetical protein